MKYAVVIEKSTAELFCVCAGSAWMRGYRRYTRASHPEHSGGDRLPPGRHARGRNINTRTAGVNRPGRGLDAREQSDANCRQIEILYSVPGMPFTKHRPPQNCTSKRGLRSRTALNWTRDTG